MKCSAIFQTFGLLVFLFSKAEVAQAQAIQQACLQSDRGGSQLICRCIQGAADQILSNRDQRRAARFFRDPDEAQRVRRSDRRRDEAFWERYRAFGERAERSCRS